MTVSTPSKGRIFNRLDFSQNIYWILLRLVSILNTRTVRMNPADLIRRSTRAARRTELDFVGQPDPVEDSDAVRGGRQRRPAATGQNRRSCLRRRRPATGDCARLHTNTTATDF